MRRKAFTSVKLIAVVLVLVLFIAVLSPMMTLFLRSIGWGNKAVSTVFNEVDPENLLRKYEWFKDAAAQLNKKQADIKVYKARIKQFDGIERKDMDRADKEQAGLWWSEVAGVIASYNSLAAEYNAQMAKINYSFCNVGQLPKGATEPLPREFAPYMEE